MAEAFVKTFKRDYVRVGLIPDASAALALVDSWTETTTPFTRSLDWAIDHRASTFFPNPSRVPFKGSTPIGYVGDSYVDFGISGALGICFMLGVLYALIARQILALSNACDIALGIAVLVVVLSPVPQFEIGSIKLFPGVLWAWMLGSFAIWIVWPRVRPFFYARPRASASICNDASGPQGLLA